MKRLLIIAATVIFPPIIMVAWVVLMLQIFVAVDDAVIAYDERHAVADQR